MDKIIDLSPADLRKLQLIELEMLVEVDRICRKNNIHYSLSGGTLLGAVRHKGFIPWDDDLDIMFLHDEYEKFFQACQTELDTNRFFFQDYRTDPNYRWGYGKLRRRNTEYIKAGQEKLKQKTGICIDIFDFENVPNNFQTRKRYLKIMKCIRKTLYSAMGRTNEELMLFRLLYQGLYLLPNALVHRVKNVLTEKINQQITDNVLCLMWPEKGCPYGYSRSIFSKYTDLDFEGMKFMAIQEYDTYLRIHYGNYMQLPPVESRKGVMNAVKYKLIDVSYEDIQKTYLNGFGIF